ncbi:MAG: 30S ribosomal protein S19 [Nanoarchaeota archaeon]|nr:30S ribosomal protein S19 [Nanoarchaeota archaeon]
MAKEFKYRGKTLEELKKMSISEFAQVTNSSARRTLKRGLTEPQKIFLKIIEKAQKEKSKKPIKTHCRDLVVIPQMIGMLILVHNGKVFNPVQITEEMLGRRLGEFSFTRPKVKHSAPGIGATKSSGAMSVK